MKYNNYFEYDGNIPSQYTAFDSVRELVLKAKENKVPEEAQEETAEVTEPSLSALVPEAVQEPETRSVEEAVPEEMPPEETPECIPGEETEEPVPEEEAEEICPEEEISQPEPAEEVSLKEETFPEETYTLTDEESKAMIEQKVAEIQAPDEITPEELAAAIKAFEGQGERPLHKADIERASESAEAQRPSEEEKGGEAVQEEQKEKRSSFERRRGNKEGKEVSKLKRFFVAVFMLLLIVAIFTGVIYICMESINKGNERISKFNANAAKVCADYTNQYGAPNYENLYSTYGVEGYRLTGVCFVRELDFNNDGESELMISYNKSGVYYNEVWGLNDKKEFSLLFSDVAAQTEKKKDDAYSILYHTGNKYYIAKFDSQKSNHMKLYQLKNNRFTEKYSCVYDAKTKSYTVDDKDDTNAFERILYSVLKEEKASVSADTASDEIGRFSVSGIEESKPVAAQTMNSAYYTVVQEYNKRYGTAQFYDDSGLAYVGGLAVVRLVDFDGDKQNELLLVYRKTVLERAERANDEYVSVNVDKYYCDIFRYSGNKAVLAYSNEGLSNVLNDRSDIYYMLRFKDKETYYCVNSFTNNDYGKHISAVSSRLKFNGSEFVSDFKASYTTDYGSSEYFIDGEEVDKYEFNNKGYALPFFDGGTDYDKDIYEVTYVQRKSSKADDVKNLPSKTEKEIQKLNPSYSSDANN